MVLTDLEFVLELLGRRVPPVVFLRSEPPPCPHVLSIILGKALSFLPGMKDFIQITANSSLRSTIDCFNGHFRHFCDRGRLVVVVVEEEGESSGCR